MPVPRNDEPGCYVIPLSLSGDELLSVDTTPRSRGWSAYFSTAVVQVDAEVLLRLTLTDSAGAAPRPSRPSALQVGELRVLVGQRAPGFASSLLREIPVLRIEAAINQTAHREHLVANALAASNRDTVQSIGGDAFRKPPAVTPTLSEIPLTVVDPGGYKKPDSFYRDVAEIYLRQAAVSARPAQDLAEANGVPAATVHRWIREAKARGVLNLPTHREAN